MNHMHEALKKKMMSMKANHEGAAPAPEHAHGEASDKLQAEETKGDNIAGAAPDLDAHSESKHLNQIQATPTESVGNMGPPDEADAILKGKAAAHTGEPMDEGMFGKMFGGDDIPDRAPQGLREHAMHAMHARIKAKKAMK